MVLRDASASKKFPSPFFHPGRFLNSRPVLGFVATSTFPLLASSANHPPSVRQNDCLVSFRVVLGILVRKARGQEFSYLFRHNFNFCTLQILQDRINFSDFFFSFEECGVFQVHYIDDIFPLQRLGCASQSNL